MGETGLGVEPPVTLLASPARLISRLAAPLLAIMSIIFKNTNKNGKNTSFPVCILYTLSTIPHPLLVPDDADAAIVSIV